MTRSIWTAVGALVLAAAVAIPVIAQPPQGGRGPGRGPGGPLPMLRGLDLTDAQKDQIKTARPASLDTTRDALSLRRRAERRER